MIYKYWIFGLIARTVKVVRQIITSTYIFQAAMLMSSYLCNCSISEFVLICQFLIAAGGDSGSEGNYAIGWTQATKVGNVKNYAANVLWLLLYQHFATIYREMVTPFNRC